MGLAGPEDDLPDSLLALRILTPGHAIGYRITSVQNTGPRQRSATLPIQSLWNHQGSGLIGGHPDRLLDAHQLHQATSYIPILNV